MQKYDDPQVLARLAALKTMTVKELKAEWSKLMGSEAPNNSSQFMIQRLSYRIQELAFGGMSKPLVRTLDALADEYEGKKVRKSVIADPRNPIIGTRLIREWNGTEHTVTVLKDGFDWQGQRFKSLSAIAKTITGTSWNGYRFFGLRQAEGAR
ncbi:MAG: DUF2924 domain-containing protein [Sphingomonas sp.]|nr:DUF2924 domain-containing protein [Sphingomonas sp.]